MRMTVAVVLVVVGVIALIVGVVYMTVPAHALPAFIPGHLAHNAHKHSQRGEAGLIVGALLVVAGAAGGLLGRRRYAA